MLDTWVEFLSSNEYLEQVVHIDPVERDANRTEITDVHKPARLAVLLRLRSYLPHLKKNVLKTKKSPKLQVPPLQFQPQVKIIKFPHFSSSLFTRKNN